MKLKLRAIKNSVREEKKGNQNNTIAPHQAKAIKATRFSYGKKKNI
jgi:hypothetical protein